MKWYLPSADADGLTFIRNKRRTGKANILFSKHIAHAIVEDSHWLQSTADKIVISEDCDTMVQRLNLLRFGCIMQRGDCD